MKKWACEIIEENRLFLISKDTEMINLAQQCAWFKLQGSGWFSEQRWCVNRAVWGAVTWRSDPERYSPSIFPTSSLARPLIRKSCPLQVTYLFIRIHFLIPQNSFLHHGKSREKNRETINHLIMTTVDYLQSFYCKRLFLDGIIE